MKKDFIPNIIDIEASGFGSESYPIEIGLIRSDGLRYCSLIRPHESWRHWDAQAETLHGISRTLIESRGKAITQVCLDLNECLKGQVAYSDAWSHDAIWLRRLYEFSGLNCEFNLSPIESIASESQLHVWDEVKENLVLALGEHNRHRATNDALLVQAIFRESYLKIGQRT